MQKRAMTRSPGGSDVEIEATGFKPDWTATWTAAVAETELSGFKFEGPGWYFTKTRVIPRDVQCKGEGDTILVVPTFHAGQPMEEGEEQTYLFCVYNRRNPAEAFNWIVNAPTRVDER